jgi:putative two-component system response regulator
VFAVADVLDAMTHDRPYRAARPLTEALDVVQAGAGKQFDRRVAEAALALPAARWAEVLGLAI